MRIRQRLPRSQLIDGTGVLVHPGWLLLGLCLAAAAKAIEPPFELFYPPTAAPFGAGWSLARYIASGWAVILVLFMLAGGILGDIYGRRRMLLWGLALMLLANVLLLFSPGTLWHVLWRILAHISAGVVLPLTLAPIYIFFEGRQRAIAFAIYLSTTALASLLSIYQGRFIVQYLDWHAVYLIPSLLTVVAFVSVRRSLPESRAADPRLMDAILYSGWTILILGVIFGIFELSLVRHWVTSVAVIMGFALAAGLGLIFWWRRVTRGDPLRTTSIHTRHITLLLLCGVILQIALFGFNSLTYSYYRVGLNLGFLQTLLKMSPMLFGMLTVIYLVARHWAKQQVRLILAIGFFLIVMSITSMALFARMPYWMQIFPLVVFGLSIIGTKTIWTNAFFQILIDRYIGLNAGMNSAALIVGSALGGVLSTELLARFGQSAFVRQSTSLTLSEAELISIFKNITAAIIAKEEAGIKDLALAISDELYASYQQAYITGYAAAIMVIAVICLLTALLIFLGIRASLKYSPTDTPLNEDFTDLPAVP